MLRLNRMTDYAILVLGFACRPGELLSSAPIAHHAQLTQATVAKIIKALRQQIGRPAAAIKALSWRCRPPTLVLLRLSKPLKGPSP